MGLGAHRASPYQQLRDRQGLPLLAQGHVGEERTDGTVSLLRLIHKRVGIHKDFDFHGLIAREGHAPRDGDNTACRERRGGSPTRAPRPHLRAESSPRAGRTHGTLSVPTGHPRCPWQGSAPGCSHQRYPQGRGCPSNAPRAPAPLSFGHPRLIRCPKPCPRYQVPPAPGLLSASAQGMLQSSARLCFTRTHG